MVGGVHVYIRVQLLASGNFSPRALEQAAQKPPWCLAQTGDNAASVTKMSKFAICSVSRFICQESFFPSVDTPASGTKLYTTPDYNPNPRRSGFPLQFLHGCAGCPLARFRNVAVGGILARSAPRTAFAWLTSRTCDAAASAFPAEQLQAWWLPGHEMDGLQEQHVVKNSTPAAAPMLSLMGANSARRRLPCIMNHACVCFSTAEEHSSWPSSSRESALIHLSNNQIPASCRASAPLR